jgi:hypothetical protein
MSTAISSLQRVHLSSTSVTDLTSIARVVSPTGRLGAP